MADSMRGYRTSDWRPPARLVPLGCITEGCDWEGEMHAHGMCQACYRRQWRATRARLAAERAALAAKEALG